MKKRLKSISLVVASIMLASTVFVGCSKSEPAKPDAPKTETDGAETDAPEQDTGDEEEVTIKFYSWQTDQMDENEEVVEAYKAIKPNVNVEFEYIGDMTADDYYQKVDLMLMGGEEMDIVMAASYAEHAKRAASGSYLPLEEYFEAEGLTADEAYTMVSPVNDVVYGIPGDLKSWFVLMNKDHLDEAGLPVPDLDWTWDDYRDYAKQLTQGEGTDKRFGSYFHTWHHFNYLSLWSTKLDNGLLISETEGNFDDPGIKDFLQFRYELDNVDESQVPYADIKALNLTYRSEFFNENASMIPIGSWMIPELADQDKFPHDFVTTVAPIPRWGEDAPAGRTLSESHHFSIAKTSKHPQEAYDFMRFYTTEGMKIKGVSISGEVGVDKMDFIDQMMTDKQYYDVEAFERVMNNPDWYDNNVTISPVSMTTITTMFEEECEKYLLDSGVTLDETIESIKTKGEKILEEN